MRPRADASIRSPVVSAGIGSPWPPAYFAPICPRTISRPVSTASSSVVSSTRARPWNIAPCNSGNRSLRSTSTVHTGLRRRFAIFWPRQ
jgi:hypothetical protein